MGMLIHRENIRRRMAEEAEKQKSVEQPKPLPEVPEADEVKVEEPKKKGGRPKKSV